MIKLIIPISEWFWFVMFEVDKKRAATQFFENVKNKCILSKMIHVINHQFECNLIIIKHFMVVIIYNKNVDMI